MGLLDVDVDAEALSSLPPHRETHNMADPINKKVRTTHQIGKPATLVLCIGLPGTISPGPTGQVGEQGVPF